MSKYLLIVCLFIIPANAGHVAMCQDVEIDTGQDLDLDNLDLEPYEYEPNPNRVRLRSVVNEDLLNRFRRGEPLLIKVPEAGNQVVSSIRIEKSEFFKPESIEIRPRTLVDGQTLIIYMAVNTLERLDYQPLDIVVYQSNISTFQIVPIKNDSEIQTPTRNNIRTDFYVRLKPRNGVAVAFSLNKSFHLENGIFDVKLPFEEIDGIFFADQDDASVSVVLRNGDNISGTHSWPQSIDFETPWGNETIQLDQVVSVTRNRSVKVVPSGVDNPRWAVQKQTDY